MSDCLLNSGYDKPCFDSESGVKSVMFARKADAVWTEGTGGNEGVVTTIVMANGTRFWKWNLEHETANANSTETFTRANGTRVYEEAINIMLNDNSRETRNSLLAYGRTELIAIVETNDGDFELYGKDYGLVKTSANRLTGTALGERNGNEIVFSGREKSSPLKVDSTIIAALLIPAS
jgi:hypothetical protein